MRTEKTKAMIEREEATSSTWKNKGNGYYILQGSFYVPVIYIALPEGHPDIKTSYNDLNPDVNGGLTYKNENVFGWDYNHFDNDYDFEGHIQNALEYFKKREISENSQIMNHSQQDAKEGIKLLEPPKGKSALADTSDNTKKLKTISAEDECRCEHDRSCHNLDGCKVVGCDCCGFTPKTQKVHKTE